MICVERRPWKAALLLGCAGLAITAAGVCATPALAQTPPAQQSATYDIPAQDLGAALTLLSRRSGREIVFSADLVRGLRTPGSRGRSFEGALNGLLDATGLAWRVNASGAVVIVQGNVQAAAGVVPAAATEIDEIVVTGVRNSISAERYRAAVPVDVLSQEDFGRYTGSDAADLLIRIPGVSISAEGNFAVIRGLSERYNAVTFDGMVLPSSDPERQSVELDQFPSRLLDGMIVYKAFSSEQPGNLSGGGVELRPLRFPDQRILSFSVGASASEDVFTGDQDFLTYSTGGYADLYGRGSDDRISTDAALDPNNRRFAFPPSSERPFTARPENMPLGPRASFIYGDSFRLDNGVQIGVGLAAVYEASYDTESGTFNEGARFDGSHAVGEVRYGETFLCRNNAVLDCVVGETTPAPRDGYSYVRSQQDVALAVLANLAVRFNENHEISLTGFTSQTATDRAQYDDDIIAWSRSEWQTPHSGAMNAAGAGADTAWRYRYTLDYRERNLSTLALVGDHVFPSINGGQLGWAVAHSTAYQDEPDSRRLLFLNPYGTDYFIAPAGTDIDPPIFMSWRRIEEAQDNLRLSWRQPLGDGDAFFEFGLSHSETERDYAERMGEGQVAPILGGSDEGVTLGYFGPRRFSDPNDIWTRIDSHLLRSGSDRVNLTRQISALYFLGGTSLFTPDLTLSGGVRFERTVSRSDGFGGVTSNPNLSSAWHYLRNRAYFPELQHLPTGGVTPELLELAQSDIDQVDFLPAINLTWRATPALTLRLAASETIARPSLREMGNYYTWDPDSESYDYGNALLQVSRVRNLDARAEYRFGGGFASLSLFQKEIENPIERFGMAHPSSNAVTIGSWLNNPDTADLQGAEFEFRSNFAFVADRFGGWSRPLSGLTLGGNATWIDAEVHAVTVDPNTRRVVSAPNRRRLYDQPEWIVNFDATYDYEPWGSSVTLSWVAMSEVLTRANYVEVEQGGVIRAAGYDEHRDETSRLDLVISQRITDRYALKFSARNLLDPEQLYVRDREQTGGVEIVDRRWREGRSFSLTLTAEF